MTVDVPNLRMMIFCSCFSFPKGIHQYSMYIYVTSPWVPLFSLDIGFLASHRCMQQPNTRFTSPATCWASNSESIWEHPNITLAFFEGLHKGVKSGFNSSIPKQYTCTAEHELDLQKKIRRLYNYLH